MLKNYFQRNYAFRLRIVFLFCVILPRCVSGKNTNVAKSFENLTIPVYQKSYDWTLAPVGKSAKDLLRIFFLYSSTNAIRLAFNRHLIGGTYKAMVNTIIGYTFVEQVIMTICVTVGILIVLLLLISPYFILMYRRRQLKLHSDDSEVHWFLVRPEQGWLLYEFFSLALAVAVFGGILMYMSLREVEGKFTDLFDLAVFMVEMSYDIKEFMLDQFYNGLNDISFSAFEVIRLMYDVNDDIGDKFMEHIRYRIKPVSFLAKSLQWDVAGIVNLLKIEKERFESYVNTTNTHIGKFSEKYLVTLRELNNTLLSEGDSQNFSSRIAPLFGFPNFTPPNVTFENFDESIKRLEGISALDFQARLQNISRYLHTSIIYPNYDPSDVMEKLRKIAFETERTIHVAVSRFFHFVDGNLKLEDKNRILKTVETARSEVLRSINFPRILLIILSIVSAALGILFFIIYTVGLFGTKGFRIRPSGVSVSKSDVSHYSGKTLIVLVYFAVIFLALFWIASIFLFFLSAIPFEMCLASKDLSLFEVAMDNRARHSAMVWYSLYSSKEFNNSIKNTFEKCKKDPSYFKLLPDPLVNQSRFEDIKNQLNTSAAAEAIENIVQNLPNGSISESENSILDLRNVLDFNFHSFFVNINEFLQGITELNAPSVFDEISKHPDNSEKLNSAVQTVIKSYETLIDILSNTLAEELTYSDSLASVNNSAHLTEKQIESFKIAVEVLVDFLQKNTTSIYLSALNSTVAEMIDGVYYNMDLSTKEFRYSISVCRILNVAYARINLNVCERFLFPWSAAWMGSLFVDLFLLLAVFLCLYSVPLFLIPPVVNSSDIPPTMVYAEDIPNEVVTERSLANVLLTEKKSIEEVSPNVDKNGVASTSASKVPNSTHKPPNSDNIKQDPSEKTISSAATSDDNEYSAKDSDSSEQLAKEPVEDVPSQTVLKDIENKKEKSLESLEKVINGKF